MGRKVTDLTGKRFGKLLVIKLDYVDSTKGGAYWLCKCECGNTKTILGRSLTCGLTKGCGCGSSNRGHVEKRTSLLKDRGNSQTIFQIYTIYRLQAIKRGYSFNLSLDEFIKATTGVCFYCGAAPSNVHKGRFGFEDFIYNGIDRVNNNEGYEISNCVPCCGVCNEKKRAMEQSEFLAWIERVYNHSIAHKI